MINDVALGLGKLDLKSIFCFHQTFIGGNILTIPFFLKQGIIGLNLSIATNTGRQPCATVARVLIFPAFFSLNPYRFH